METMYNYEKTECKTWKTEQTKQQLCTVILSKRTNYITEQFMYMFSQSFIIFLFLSTIQAPDIHTQILETDLHTFPERIFEKGSKHFPFGDQLRAIFVWPWNENA